LTTLTVCSPGGSVVSGAPSGMVPTRSPSMNTSAPAVVELISNAPALPAAVAAPRCASAVTVTPLTTSITSADCKRRIALHLIIECRRECRRALSRFDAGDGDLERRVVAVDLEAALEHAEGLRRLAKLLVDLAEREVD